MLKTPESLFDMVKVPARFHFQRCDVGTIFADNRYLVSLVFEKSLDWIVLIATDGNKAFLLCL